MRIRTIRPIYFGGRAIPTHNLIEVSASEALEIVGTGRAAFLTPMDKEAAANQFRLEQQKTFKDSSPVRSSFWSRKNQEKGAQ